MSTTDERLDAHEKLCYDRHLVIENRLTKLEANQANLMRWILAVAALSLADLVGADRILQILLP